VHEKEGEASTRIVADVPKAESLPLASQPEEDWREVLGDDRGLAGLVNTLQKVISSSPMPARSHSDINYDRKTTVKLVPRKELGTSSGGTDATSGYKDDWAGSRDNNWYWSSREESTWSPAEKAPRLNRTNNAWDRPEVVLKPRVLDFHATFQKVRTHFGENGMVVEDDATATRESARREKEDLPEIEESLLSATPLFLRRVSSGSIMSGSGFGC
jgi:hypothetical protein